MEKKLILHGMKIGKGRFGGLIWGMVLLCYSLLLNPLHAKAEMCAEIDYNKPTITSGGGLITIGLKEDGTVVTTAGIDVSSWSNIKAVAVGWDHILGLREDGTVVAAGNNAYGQLDVSSWTEIKAIGASARSSFGIKEDGTVVAAGNNAYGKLNISS